MVNVTRMFVLDKNYSKYKSSNLCCLEEENYDSTTSKSEGILWSDGPSSEFKNRYMMKLMHYFILKYNKVDMEIFCNWAWKRCGRWNQWRDNKQ